MDKRWLGVDFINEYACVYKNCKHFFKKSVTYIHTDSSQNIGLNVNHRLFLPLHGFRNQNMRVCKRKVCGWFSNFLFDCLTYILTVCLELYFKINTIRSIIDLRLHTYISRLQCTFRKQYITFKSIINITR